MPSMVVTSATRNCANSPIARPCRRAALASTGRPRVPLGCIQIVRVCSAENVSLPLLREPAVGPAHLDAVRGVARDHVRTQGRLKQRVERCEVLRGRLMPEAWVALQRVAEGRYVVSGDGPAGRSPRPPRSVWTWYAILAVERGLFLATQTGIRLTMPSASAPQRVPGAPLRRRRLPSWPSSGLARSNDLEGLEGLLFFIVQGINVGVDGHSLDEHGTAVVCRVLDFLDAPPAAIAFRSASPKPSPSD